MAAKTAEQSEADTSLLTRRLFSAPRPARLVGPIAGLSVLAATFLTLPVFSWDAVGRNVLVVALPIYGSAVLTFALSKVGPGRTYLRRTTLQAFVDACLVLAFVSIVALAGVVHEVVQGAGLAYSQPRLLLLAFAATIWVRHIVWTAMYDERHRSASVLSLVTPVLGGVAVALGFPSVGATDLVLWGVLVAVFLSAAMAFTWAVNRPIAQAFGVNGIRLVRHLIDQMTGLTEESRREMEGFFDSIARPAEVRTAALAFRAPHGNVALLVATHAHPGPFARVGGSDMPAKLRTALSDVCKVVLVPHGPSTHDFNPSTTTECVKIASAVRTMLQDAAPMPGGSVFERAMVGKATATAQFFGDVAFVTASLAPNPTDDIDDATGHATIRAARDAGARDCLFVDAHNCAALAEGMIRFGSEESLQIIQAAHKAVSVARERPATSIRIGVAERTVGSVKDGFGAQGIQALVVDADGQRVAYLLFDGNNMVPGLRDEILATVKEVVDDGEVLTTDNHSVNATMGGYNPIGMRFDRRRLVSASREVVEEALSGLRPVESVARSDAVHGLRVFGHENTTRLTTSVNATISILRPTAALTLGLALAVSLVLLAVVP